MGADVRTDGGRIWDDGLIARRARTDGGGGVREETEGTPFPAGPFDTGPFEGAPFDAGPFDGARGGRTGGREEWWDGGLTGGTRAYAAPGAAPEEETLRQRLRALRELVGLSRTRLDGEVLAEAGRILDEVTARGRLSRAYTTVAVAGATGSGKSMLFNTLAGVQLSETGLRRPTTSLPVACVWETEWDSGADGLLERMGVPPRARRRVQPRDPALRGLVLIDLPDHDSAAPGHREQVDRMLRLVDAVVWVTDPEKYADAVLHERYLRPLAGHAEVTFVVLNQVDRLPGDAVDTVMDDLRRLLDEDGMALGEHGEPGATVLALSALTGQGVGELRDCLSELASSRRAAALRLSADVDGVVARLRPVYMADTPQGPAGLTERAREEFEDRLACAVGAWAAGQTAERLWLRHAEQACGTPWARLLRWYETRRGHGETAAAPAVPDAVPAAGAGAGAGPGAASGSTDGRGDGEGGRGPAAPERAAVARPVLAQAVRELAEEASAGLPQPWARSVRDAAWRGALGLPEALEDAIASAEDDGDEARPPRPRWWTVVACAQWLMLAVQLIGLYLLVDLIAGGPGWGGVWLPVALLTGGALGGPLLAGCCRIAARGPARAYGLEEERGLRRLATGWGQAWVLEPVAAELLRYREVREQYVIAAGGTDRA
ncbi:GTPase [Streptomyces chitinivorans]|uniref:GTPase n=1 Tax=Streptomyces chitinivorans TaxID=1257027 RepID=UPI00244A4632|nr:GTPase [Streptomyces chitinivorans]MDH2407652.1 50S ribosome-binding GTPase [Streptomyces chitinivorans]